MLLNGSIYYSLMIFYNQISQYMCLRHVWKTFLTILPPCVGVNCGECLVMKMFLLDQSACNQVYFQFI